MKVAGATGTELVATVCTGGAPTSELDGGAPKPPPPPKAKLSEAVATGGGGGGGGAVAAGGGGGAVAAGGGGGGTETVGSLAAFSMYFSMVLGLSFAWLMTMAIPRWQWLT